MPSSDVPEALVFRPTRAEWEDPFTYIANVVRKGAEKFGIAKIVPPAWWSVPFEFDEDGVKLPCQRLLVHHMYNRETSASEKEFWTSYDAWFDVAGGKLKKRPTFYGQDVDLYRLYRAVIKRGGYEKVTENKIWKEIFLELEVSLL